MKVDFARPKLALEQCKSFEPPEICFKEKTATFKVTFGVVPVAEGHTLIIVPEKDEAIDKQEEEAFFL